MYESWTELRQDFEHSEFGHLLYLRKPQKCVVCNKPHYILKFFEDQQFLNFQVYSNVDKTIHRNVASIRKYLPRQIVSCVKWEQSMINLFKYEKEEYLPSVFECGPGKSLSAMLQKINGRVGKRTISVQA